MANRWPLTPEQEAYRRANSYWDFTPSDKPLRLRDIPLLIVGLAMTLGLVVFGAYAAWTYFTGFLSLR